nr:reverse transcriptase domain-containing protein [Tanacetum cinerariifolium]
MAHLLEKETPFVFSKECIDSFNTLKKKLTEAPIVVVLDWNLLFELMCNASDYAIGAVLGQRRGREKYLREMRCLRTVSKFVRYSIFGTAGDHRKLQLNELSEIRDQAYENSVIYKERTKKLHDSKTKNRIFNVDDQVLLFNSRLKVCSGKLKTRWSRPFTITRVFPYGTIELSQPNGLNFKVNGHHVKHYFGGDIPSTVASDLHTFPKDN